MNERLQQNLADARGELTAAQWRLMRARQLYYPTSWLRELETVVCAAIDRAWDAQCMARGSL